MDKKKFDEVMDRWAAHEMESAPDLEPSPEVYRRLEEKRKKPRFVLFSWPVRLAAAGIAAALIALVIVMQPPKEAGPFVGLRKRVVAEKPGRGESQDRMQVMAESEEEERQEVAEKEAGVTKTDKSATGKQEEKAKETPAEEPAIAEEIPVTVVAQSPVMDKKAKETDKEALQKPEEFAAKPGKVEEPEKKDVGNEVKRSRIAAAAPAAPILKEQIVGERIQFQVQPEGSESIEDFDASLVQDEVIALSSEDNYRLLIELPEERFVYVIQAGADAKILRLFPNVDYNPAKNPLPAGEKIVVPLPPNWFYVEEDRGEMSVYVVTSAEPLQAWDEAYTDYSLSKGKTEREKVAADLLAKLEKIREDPGEQVSVKIFRFNVRNPDRSPVDFVTGYLSP